MLKRKVATNHVKALNKDGVKMKGSGINYVAKR